MIISTPIRFDSKVTITYEDGTIEDTYEFPGKKGLVKCTFPKINGRDALNSRVTNLVGYDGNEILKRCPYCLQHKHVTEFGYSGRYTNGRRDQSRCNLCRKQY